MNCPNCGARIGRFDLSANCKSCGINIFYAQQEELLSADAKKCELEFASFRIFTAKLKAAFIGGALQISRIVLLVMMLGSLFIPFARLDVSLPLFTHSISFGGYGLYKSFSDGSLLALLDFAKIDVSAELAGRALMLIAAMAMLVLFTLIIFISELLSFINIKRSATAITVVSGLAVLCSAFSVVAAVLLERAAGTFVSGMVTANAGIGGYIAALIFLTMLTVNVIIIKKDVKPVYKEVDLNRVRIRKMVKAGEISLDDLPLPVLESAEEKEARLKLEAEASEAERKAGKT